nr:hypothetical protein [Pseudomonas veronii]
MQRDGVTSACPFGSPDYDFEDLITEMGAEFLCAYARLHSGSAEARGLYRFIARPAQS